MDQEGAPEELTSEVNPGPSVSSPGKGVKVQRKQGAILADWREWSGFCLPGAWKEGSNREMAGEGSATRSGRAFWRVWAISSEQAYMISPVFI